MVPTFLLVYLPRALLTTFSPKMYEFATGRWLFNPEVMDDISRDIVHLAQMTQRTGQDHDSAALEQYGIREKQHNLRGKETRSDVFQFIHLVTPRNVEARNRGGR